MQEYEGAPLRLWLDTGHSLVRETNGWDVEQGLFAAELAPWISGMHLNDVKGYTDDHGEPGWGNVSFSRLAFLGKRYILRVFEPNSGVLASDLRNSLEYMRKLWGR